MKHFILGLGLLALSSLSAQACDQCGCASSGYMGIVPQFGRHYIGLRYQYQHFETRHLTSLADDAQLEKSKEHFHTLELKGSYYPHKRVQLLASIPFVHRTQMTNDQGNYTAYGLGDVWVGGNYTVISTPDTIGKKVRHNFLVGTGLKAPTGQNRLQQNGETLHQNLQPGTGSWDVDMNLRYILRVKRWGLSSAVNYRLNTKNRDNYKYGDRITSLIGGFYWTAYRNMTFIPQVGLNLDYALKDIENRHLRTKTGGYVLAARADVQLGFKRLITSVGYAIPITHNLSNGEVAPRHQCNVSILILI